MPFEKKDDPGKVFMFAALAEAPILIAGVVAFLMTDNIMWPILAGIVGATVFIIPAVMRIKRQQNRDTRSPYGDM